MEDDDLPVKQRMPKPRLPPTGKISSPRKRPIKEPGPGKGHPRKKLKLNDGDSVKINEGDTATNNAESSGDPVKKVVEAPKMNGEKMSREPSKNKGPTSAVAESVIAKPLTNGIVPVSHSVPTQATVVTPTAKGKGKEVNGESGSFPSPESLEAT